MATKFEQQTAEWQQQRIAATVRSFSPATTVALFRLTATPLTIGASPSNNLIVSNSPSCPACIGTLQLHPDPQVSVVLDSAIRRAVIAGSSNESFEGGDCIRLIASNGRPVLLQIGSLAIMLALSSSGPPSLLVFDDAAPAVLRLRSATPQSLFFPIRPEWRLVGDLVRNPDTNSLSITFTPPHSQVCRLFLVDPVDPKTGSFAIAFHDASNRYETAASGRIVAGIVLQNSLDTPSIIKPAATRLPNGTVVVNPQPSIDLSVGCQVILDFNRAVHRPCAYTPFAQCAPIDPRNHLPIRVDAGERSILNDMF
eukprot:jgi/Hompol1/1561/HPOL_003423-RA